MAPTTAAFATNKNDTPTRRFDREMATLADQLAEKNRANEKTQHRASTPLNPDSPDYASLTGTGSFERRMSKRYDNESVYLQQRAGLAVDHGGKRQSFAPSQNLHNIAELEGDAVQASVELSDGEICMRSAKEAMMRDYSENYSQGFVVGGGGEGTAVWHPSLSPLENVTAKTRMHLLGTDDPKATEKLARKVSRARKQHDNGPLSDTTTETRMLMVGLISADELLEPAPKQSRSERRTSKFMEQGLSPGNRRIDDYSREQTATPPPVRALSLNMKMTRMLALKTPSVKLLPPIKKLSPKRTMSLVPGRNHVSVGGAAFDIIQPASPSTKKLDLSSFLPQRDRGISRNFSLPWLGAQDHADPADHPTAFGLPPATVDYNRKTDFMSLPFDVRNKIYSLTVVAPHDILVCMCGVCDWSMSKQPVLSKVTRQIRAEVLPLFYGENHFVLRGSYDWRHTTPAFLRGLSQNSCALVKHVEISTKDITSAICMMATLGFALSHRLPGKDRVCFLQDMQLGVIYMTFTSISRVVQAYERLPEIKRAPPIQLFEDESIDTSGYPSGHIAELDAGDTASITTVNSTRTSVLNPERYDGVVGQGMEARRVRGRVVTVGSDDAMPVITRTDKRTSSGTTIIFHPTDLDLASDVGIDEPNAAEMAVELDRLEEMMFRRGGDRMGGQRANQSKRLVAPEMVQIRRQ
ncbi:hypothetical protein LTR17_022412 [Elasticomyces elasticus]|nr:hypothetical protein LTR17_022412 [Elasticomyces elasticus]